MISKVIIASVLAAVPLFVGAGSASADWNRPSGGYGGPSQHRHDLEQPRYREGPNRFWWHRHQGMNWGWRGGHARWDDRAPPHRDWRYD
jgi:hypothetical protein